MSFSIENIYDVLCGTKYTYHKMTLHAVMYGIMLLLLLLCDDNPKHHFYLPHTLHWKWTPVSQFAYMQIWHQSSYGCQNWLSNVNI